MALSQAIDHINLAMRDVQLTRVADTTFSGTAQAFRARCRQGILLLLSIVVIYWWGILSRASSPPPILSGLPTAGLGALLTLMAFGHRTQHVRLRRHLMLIGIVKTNAIMMIDFAIEAQRKEACAGVGDPPGRHRALPADLMTTMAALMGSLPIAIASAPAGGARHAARARGGRRPLCSQVLTL